MGSPENVKHHGPSPWALSLKGIDGMVTRDSTTALAVPRSEYPRSDADENRSYRVSPSATRPSGTGDRIRGVVGRRKYTVLLTLLTIIGSAAFALSGALVALEEDYDIFGILVLGFLTAFAGGMIRNLIVGIPIAGVWHQNGAFTAALIAIAGSIVSLSGVVTSMA